MPKKKKIPAEFRFYEVPQEEPVLALLGDKWIQVYGENIDNQHFHNLLEIGICYYGTGDLIIETDEYRFDQNMIACIPMNILHVTKSDKNVPASWEYLYIDPEYALKASGKHSVQEVKAIMEAVNKNAFFIPIEEYPTFSNLVKNIIEEMRNKNDFYKETVSGLVYSLIFTIARYNGNKQIIKNIKKSGLQLDKAISYVEDNYAKNFKIADLAVQCHMSETHFRRVFQEKMNMTPIEYVNFVRVKKACEIIDKSNISMEEVAERVGFETPSTFNRNFRKIIGTSPYQWKKRPENHEGKLLDYKISALKGW